VASDPRQGRGGSGAPPARAWFPDGTGELRKPGATVLARLRGFLDGALGEMQQDKSPVSEVMSRDVRTCTDEETLDVAARILWESDCGSVPVVHPDRKRVVGMLTDRDICMASYTTGRPLHELQVGSARSRQAWCCPSSATVAEALAMMRHRQVNRLPVVDAEDHLVGLLSLADVAVRGQRESQWRPLLRGDDVAATFAEIRERRP